MQVIDENSEAIHAIFQRLSVHPLDIDCYAQVKSHVDTVKAQGGTGTTYGQFESGKNSFHFEVKLWITEADERSRLHLTHVKEMSCVGDGNICWEIEGS